MIKALSDECSGKGQRLRNASNFWHPLISFKISAFHACLILWLDAHHGNLRCLCVLFFSFVNVIRFSWFKRNSFLMRCPMQHSCDRAFKFALLTAHPDGVLRPIFVGSIKFGTNTGASNCFPPSKLNDWALGWPLAFDVRELRQIESSAIAATYR